MLVSVIIPTFNRESVLPRALNSVFAQDRDGLDFELEVIVVDDGSTDGTRKLIASEYPSVRYFFQQNTGVSAARNHALSEARGEWLALLDSDDEWLPNKLSCQLAVISQSKHLVCHTEEIWVRNGVRVNQMNKHKKFGGDIFTRCLPMCAMSPSSILIHDTVFQRVGYFDEALPACEDYDLWLRICAHFDVDFVSEPCIKKFGGHADQLSRQYWGMDRFRLEALDKVLSQEVADLKLNEHQYAAALKMLLKKNRILLKGAIKHSNQALVDQCQHRLSKFDESLA